MEVRQTPVIAYPQKVEAVKAIKPLQELPDKQPFETSDQIPKEQLVDKVESMNKFLEQSTSELKYQLHEKLNTYYVQLVDPKTDEVLREIPNKKFLDMYASMLELTGLVIDDKI
ncbi:flagellar protein FlaG [Planomicrobium sp. CPCC 101110]|uniref:flagellar protein FlaG n=1 Tax=Planomicrobium sp. CPCC 101110 TaxID=2599619 RepID=UPI0011B3F567|nr:flagellar protein FlaG [Planomicrobium sp. CPCC 101110]TWT27808.1 flagellar protein FlaG [Planomicrobium sp. CPCC 101110]